MLEGIVTKLLMHYLKDYIESLDSSQMQTAIWKGNIILKDVELRSTALTTHLIPFRILRGRIKYLEVNFPWKRLSSEPTTVDIENVFIVLTPDSETMIKRDLQANQKAFTAQKTNEKLSNDEEEETWQSILNAVYKNARISIKNIHVRIEIEREFTTLAFGFSIQSIDVTSVDKDRKEVYVDKHDVVIRKRVLITALLVYFDTISEPMDLVNFDVMMEREMRNINHQFILEPTYIDGILIHSRLKQNPIRNQFDIVSGDLLFNLDFQQAREIMNLNKDFMEFNLRRKYLHCMRPPVFENTQQCWEYTFRCAIAKVRPYEFHPETAMAILKSRKKYLSQLKKAVDPSGFKLVKGYRNRKIKEIEDKIGPGATLFLRAYCEAVIQKEKRERETSMSISEIKEIRTMIAENDKFFSLDSFSVSGTIPRAVITLQYVRNEPLFSITVSDMMIAYHSSPFARTLHVSVGDLEMNGYDDDKNPYSMCSVDHTDHEEFCTMDVVFCQKTEDTIVVAPFQLAPNYQTIAKATEFFVDKSRSMVVDDSHRIRRKDAADSVESLFHLRNHIISIELSGFAFVYPFKHNDEIVNIRFEVVQTKLKKEAPNFIQKREPIRTIAAFVETTVKPIEFAGHRLTSEFLIKLKTSITCCSGYVDTDNEIRVENLEIDVPRSPFALIDSLKSCLGWVVDAQTEETGQNTVISYRRMKNDVFVYVKLMSVHYAEMDCDTMLKIGDLECVASMNLGTVTAGITINSLLLSDHGKELATIRDKFEIQAAVEDNRPMSLVITLPNPVIVADLNWMDNLMASVDAYLKHFGISLDQKGDIDTSKIPHLRIDVENLLCKTSSEDNALALKAHSFKLKDDQDFNMTIKFKGFTMVSDTRCVMEPCDYSIFVKYIGDIFVKMNLPAIGVNLTRNDFEQALHWIAHMLKLIPLKSDNERKNEQKVALTMESFHASCFDPEKAWDVSLGKMSVDVAMVDKQDNIDCQFETLRIVECYTDHETELIGTDKLLVSCVNTDGLMKVKINLEDCCAGVSDRVIRLFVWFWNYDWPENPLPNKGGNASVTIDCPHFNVKVIDPTDDILLGNLGKVSMCVLVFPKEPHMLEFSINTELKEFTSSLIKFEPVLEFDQAINLALRNRTFGMHMNQVKLNINALWLHKFVNAILPASTMKMPKTQNSSALPPFDLDIQIAEIAVDIFNSIECVSSVKIGMKDLGVLLNHGHGVAAITVSTIELSTDQKQFCTVPSFSAFVGLNGKSARHQSFSELSALSHEPNAMITEITVLELDANVSDIDISYDHDVALAIVHGLLICQVELQAPEQQELENTEPETPKKLPDRLDISASMGKVTLSIGDVATVSIPAFSVSLKNHIIEAYVPAIKFSNEEMMHFDDEMCIRIHSDIRKTGIVVMIAPLNIYFDYKFWLPVATYFLRSPFMHIPQKPGPSGAATLKAPPIDIRFEVPAINVTLPTKLESSDSQILKMEMGIEGGFTKGVLRASVKDMCVYVRDEIAKINYLPILGKCSVIVRSRKSMNNRMSLEVEISRVDIAVSRYDWALLNVILESVKEVINSAPTQPEVAHHGQSATPALDLQLLTQEISAIVVKDNRSSQRYIPLFKLVLPEFSGQISTASAEFSELHMAPYVAFFNETTGHWDQLIEPIDMQASVKIYEGQITSLVKIFDPVNVNIPMHMIGLVSTLLKELENVSTTYERVPSIWMENRSNCGITCRFSDYNGDDNTTFLNPKDLIPIFDIDLEKRVELEVEDEVVELIPRFLVHPKFYSNHLCVLRRPYKGGTLIQFNSPMYFENQLPITIPICIKCGLDWYNLMTVAPHERVPVDESFVDKKGREVMFTDPQFKSVSPHLTIKLSRSSSGKFPVTVYHRQCKVRCLVKIDFDPQSSCKVFTLVPVLTAVSHLPAPLKVKFGETIVTMEEGEEHSLLHVDPQSGSMTVELSLDCEDEFSDLMTIPLKKAQITPVKIPSRFDGGQSEIAVSFTEIDDDQWKLWFFSPVVVFNMTSWNISVTDLTTKKDDHKVLTVDSEQCALWIPSSVIEKEMDFDIGLATTGTKQCTLKASNHCQLLELESDSDMFLGIGTVMTTNSRGTSIITLSPLLVVENQLDVDVILISIVEIPKETSDDYQKVGYLSSAVTVGPTLRIKAHEKVTVEKVSKSCSFMLSVDGFTNSPAFQLITPQKSVAKLNREDLTSRLIQVDVEFMETSYHAVIRDCEFPTPIVIANCLDKEVIRAYQIIDRNPFVIEPRTTSVFAYDEPFGYPAVRMEVMGKETVSLNISLLEDTEDLQLLQELDGQTLYLDVRRNKAGVRVVTLGKEPVVHVKMNPMSFTADIDAVMISLIDMQMREFALFSLNGISSKVTMSEGEMAVNLKIRTMQIDDQNPLAPNPVVVLGRESKGDPFIELNAVMVADSNRFNIFKYFSLLLQRIDVQVDPSFISDIMFITKDLDVTQPRKIMPKSPQENAMSKSKPVTCNWIEVSPLYMMMSVKTLTGRSSVYPMNGLMRLIPNVFPFHLLVPGIVIAQITDQIHLIVDKVSSDYKTALLEQALAALGTSGKMLTAFGVTATIAEKLNISLNSQLTDSIQNYASATDESFDNRREVFGCFSEETLNGISNMLSENELRPSAIIDGVQDGEDVGLKIRELPSSGFGHGIAGVIGKTTIDTLDDVKIMEGSQRVRTPRAFPGRVIDAFNPEISAAQNTIQQSDKSFKKIEIAATKAGENEYVCLTETYLFELEVEKSKVKTKIKFEDIKSIHVDGPVLEIKYGVFNKVETIKFDDDATAQLFSWYIESQRVFADIF